MKAYLDNNSTTPLAPEVLHAMLPYLHNKYGNASSIHSWGREAKKALEESRETIADILGASSAETVCFTGSGSESDNMAIQGAARAFGHRKKHIVTSAVEHSAVLNTCAFLEEEGFHITYVKPDEKGVVRAEAVAEAIQDETFLISIMHANNETGTVNPIPEIGRIARKRNILFHTDAVQSFCKIPFTVQELGADLISLSGHKIHGPKGIGVLYMREGLQLKPLIHGGHQERGRRAGTENIAAIAGLAKAAQAGSTGIKDAAQKMKTLRDRLEKGLLAKMPRARLNGHHEQRLPNTLNLSFPYVESESLLLELDLKGVAVSSGSACTSGTGEPSHVLLAMGIPYQACRGALRFSLGTQTTEAEIEYVLEVLPQIVARIQAMSPLSEAG